MTWFKSVAGHPWPNVWCSDDFNAKDAIM